MVRVHTKDSKLSLEVVTPISSERDFEGFENEHRREEAGVIRDILDVCNNLRLKVSKEDVEELVESHRENLTTEDLQQLQDEKNRAGRGKIIRAGGEEEPNEDENAITTEQLKHVLSKWRDEKRQVRLDPYLKSSDEPQPDPSGIKKMCGEHAPPNELPSVNMIEDSHPLLGKILPQSPEADEPAAVGGHSSSSD